MDGVDVALIRTDGQAVSEFGPFRTYPYCQADRAVVAASIACARNLSHRDDRPGALAAGEALITKRHVEAVKHFLADFFIAADQADAVGFHGQTVLHDPGRAMTVQIGDGDVLAREIGIPVVWDMRADDMAAGGQGAPLAPVYHLALANSVTLPRPVAFLNIGGVANITWIGEDDALVAFDCGPGNALIDDWMQANSGEQFDRNGETARSGAEPDAGILGTLLSDDYFRQTPPKSLDRDHFKVSGIDALSVADGARLLTRFTVASIGRATECVPALPEAWIVTGGGRRNLFLMEALRIELQSQILAVESFGFNGDAIEAQAFAFLAARSLCRLPLTFPGTTGVPKPLTGGQRSHPA